MSNQEKWVKLFEEVVGRKPNPDEFMKGKASDFDLKAIKSIARLEAPSEGASQINSQIENSQPKPKENAIQSSQKPLTKADKMKRYGIFGGILISALLIGSFFYFKSITGTKVAAEEFNQAVESNDFEKVAQLLSNKDQTWNKNEAKEYLQYFREQNIDLPQEIDKIASTNAEGRYNDINGNKLIGLTVKNKKFGIFPEYQIQTYPLTIYAETNLSEVSIDGKKIESNKKIELGETKFISQEYKIDAKTDLGKVTTDIQTNVKNAENNEVNLKIASNKYTIDASIPAELTEITNVRLNINGKEIAKGLNKELTLLDNQKLDINANFDYAGSTYSTNKLQTVANPAAKNIKAQLTVSSDVTKKIQEAQKANADKKAKEAQAAAEAEMTKEEIQYFMNDYISAMRSSISNRSADFEYYFDTNSAVYNTYVNFVENQVADLNIDYQSTIDYTVTDVKKEGSDYVVTIYNKYKEVYMNGKTDIVEKNQVFKLRPKGDSYLIYQVSDY